MAIFEFFDPIRFERRSSRNRIGEIVLRVLRFSDSPLSGYTVPIAFTNNVNGFHIFAIA